jgi:DNA-binding response OmpR family regulator
MMMKMSEKKVLVIDDEDFIRELVKDFLELDEVQCKGAETPEIALELIEGEDFDLILLDRNLGKIKAEDFVSQIKQIRPGVPIVILTGDQLCDDPYLKQIGADGIIFKPFQVTDFLEGVKKFLENE